MAHKTKQQKPPGESQIRQGAKQARHKRTHNMWMILFM